MQKILNADQRQKAKPQRKGPAGSSPRFVPIDRRNWIDVEQVNYSFSEYEGTKESDSFLLRHSQPKCIEKNTERFISGELKENLQNQFTQSIHLSDDRWNSLFGSRRRSKKGDSSTVLNDFRNNCFFPSSSRTFRTQSY